MLTKLITLIKRCRISKPGNDSGEYPISQVSYYGKTGNSEEIYPYGMGGVAPTDSLGVLFSVGAEDSNRAHIATAPSLRPKNLKSGESYFGNLLSKSIMIFKENGDWDVTITKDGNLTVSGNLNITVNGNSTINSSGNVSVTAGGTTTLTSTGVASVTAPAIALNGPATVNSAGGTVTVNADTVNLNSDTNLGSGGQAIARAGDPVIEASAPFAVIGTIQSGSSRHTAD
jgi:phage gp45-like